MGIMYTKICTWDNLRIAGPRGANAASRRLRRLSTTGRTIN
jgi:hypothetical protein